MASAEVHEICPGALQRPEAADILNELVRTTATMSMIVDRPVKAA